MRVRLPPDQHLDFGKMKHSTARNIQTGQSVAVQPRDAAVALNDPDVDRVADFLSDLLVELDSGLEPSTPNPHLRMILHLMRSHSEGRIVSPSSLVASAGVPYATATRKLAEVEAAGLIDRRARTRTGKKPFLTPQRQPAGRVQPIGRPHRPACTAVLWSGRASTRNHGLLFRRIIPARPRRHCPAARPARTAETVGGFAHSGAWRPDLHGHGRAKTPI